MKKRFFAAAALACALLFCLAGCSGKPKTAMDVVKAYQSHEDAGVFHMTGTVSMGMVVTAEGLAFEMPVDVDADMSVCNGMAGGTVRTIMSVMGETVDETSDLYTNGQTVYTRGSDGIWVQAPADDATSNAMSLVDDLLLEDVFSEASMEHDEAAGQYVIIVPASALSDTEMFRTMLDLTGDESDEEAQAVVNAFSQGRIRYAFDEDCYLKSVSLEDMSYTSEADGYEMTISLGMVMEFSDYGQVAGVTIPEEALDAMSQEDYDAAYGQDGLMFGAD